MTQEEKRPDVMALQGCRIGKYDIQELLGEGGMAVVYKAIHRDFETPVAIKFLLPQYTKEARTRRRFRDEARFLFQLRHPHLVRVTEIFDEEPLFGMVLDYIQGEDLSKTLHARSSPFSFDEIKQIFLPVLSAVGYAHQQGIIHRDIKPSNLLLGMREGRVFPYVTDFGVAKLLGDVTSLTKPGTLVGTPHYCSPEQIQGQQNLDHRTDIYSLGCTLYELLTLRTPFAHKSTLIEVLFGHSFEPFPSLQEAYPREGALLETLFEKACAKKSDARFASCEAFASALSSVLASFSSSDSSVATLDGVLPEALDAPTNTPDPDSILPLLDQPKANLFDTSTAEDPCEAPNFPLPLPPHPLVLPDLLAPTPVTSERFDPQHPFHSSGEFDTSTAEELNEMALDTIPFPSPSSPLELPPSSPDSHKDLDPSHESKPLPNPKSRREEWKRVDTKELEDVLRSDPNRLRLAPNAPLSGFPLTKIPQTDPGHPSLTPLPGQEDSSTALHNPPHDSLPQTDVFETDLLRSHDFSIHATLPLGSPPPVSSDAKDSLPLAPSLQDEPPSDLSPQPSPYRSLFLLLFLLILLFALLLFFSSWLFPPQIHP